MSNVIVGLLGFVIVLFSSVPTAFAEAPSTDVIRVMSFNIRYGTANDGANSWKNRRDLVVEKIREFEPDLLGTQEVLDFQRDYLLQNCANYLSWGVGRDDGKNSGEMTAIFYRRDRFEQLEGGHFWLSLTPEMVGSKSWDSSLPRICSWVRLRDKLHPNNPTILFLNTHFDHRGSDARRESASLIRKFVEKNRKESQVVITGDFNCGDSSEPYRQFFPEESENSLLIDTFRSFNPTEKNGYTFNGFRNSVNSGERIDWIGCSSDWEVRLAHIDRTQTRGRFASDHFPVTAVLRPKIPSSEQTIRILCYNIHHAEGVDGKVDLYRIARIIRNADPDYVMLQEVDHRTRRTNGIDQTSEIARLSGYHGRFASAMEFQGGQYGQAILSRQPIETGRVLKLPSPEKQEPRIAFIIPVRVGNVDMELISTHFTHNDSQIRTEQAKKLNEYLRDSSRIQILAGDFNATVGSDPIRELQKIWTLGHPSVGKNQIDFVWFRPSDRLQVKSAQQLPEPIASDHLPVLCELRLLPSMSK
ncbi:endonuclease/exonuclease/phosphatase family protein [Tuwongella immobilis]|uniref:Endonuclease/exonuclease/phosphatase domain-containing protein n=1 Tax=Tuwongella immobilis TaxID=692036 RepID=A0A6C2YMN5_9BACT|nr:endonuclease/exonuclease/phosphatase family protein [Tuwongella immobilis]VIP02858.1 Metal-dependent hydrolase OS=Singulisphaera acidiphila (strain ATCC BAA-1392 / DSM 18658 / VKM B-2454 / MOB10) GN=Sinac_0257 PE=4 SV=1: Exo_endo_phos: Exo_endo_phos [Tuwongella immobilis]VTS02662.1 Metal-dependent hydrolase OS=Singulisphaera acidiphila (strain ATCC BAA-1392 / DSM 18658 / VKM B-2454 / MOB10) GN=Sinac_0257 PE=4 SV=1: Exo_endo_phos: Exo_endo_phos [Tuwongella immobilis]